MSGIDSVVRTPDGLAILRRNGDLAFREGKTPWNKLSGIMSNVGAVAEVADGTVVLTRNGDLKFRDGTTPWNKLSGIASNVQNVFVVPNGVVVHLRGGTVALREGTCAWNELRVLAVNAEKVIVTYDKSGSPRLEMTYFDRRVEFELTFEKLRPVLPGIGYKHTVKNKEAPEVVLTLLKRHHPLAGFFPNLLPASVLEPIQAVDGGITVYGYWEREDLHGHFMLKVHLEVCKGELIIPRLEVLEADSTNTLANLFVKGKMQDALDKGRKDFEKGLNKELQKDQTLVLLLKDVSAKFSKETLAITIHYAK